MSSVEAVAALLVALLWGVQFVTGKVGVAAIPPLLFVALRFAAVAVLLLPFTGSPSRREAAAAAVISMFFGSLCFGLFFTGLRLGSAGLSAVLSQLMTPFTVLFAWPLASERPSVRVLVGTALAFGGVALALIDPGRGASATAALLVTGAVVGFRLWFWLIARCSPARVAPFALLQTVFGIAAGILVLGEPVTAPLVGGLGLHGRRRADPASTARSFHNVLSPSSRRHV